MNPLGEKRVWRVTLARRRAIIQTDLPVARNGRRRNLHVPTTCYCPLYIVGIHETAVASADATATVSNDYSVWTLCAISVSAAVVKTVVIHSVLTDQGEWISCTVYSLVVYSVSGSPCHLSL